MRKSAAIAVFADNDRVRRVLYRRKKSCRSAAVVIILFSPTVTRTTNPPGIYAINAHTPAYDCLCLITFGYRCGILRSRPRVGNARCPHLIGRVEWRPKDGFSVRSPAFCPTTDRFPQPNAPHGHAIGDSWYA